MASLSEKAKLLKRLGGFPAEPRFRQETTSRDPEILEWQRQFDIWWQELRKLLEANSKTSASDLSSHADANVVSFKQLQTQLDALSDDLDSLTDTVSGIEDEVSVIQTTLVFLQQQIDDLAASDSYTHVQASPAAVWTINHGLGRIPAVSVFDQYGVRMISKEVPVDNNTTEVYHNGTYSGTAECS